MINCSVYLKTNLLFSRKSRVLLGTEELCASSTSLKLVLWLYRPGFESKLISYGIFLKPLAELKS